MTRIQIFLFLAVALYWTGCSSSQDHPADQHDAASQSDGLNRETGGPGDEGLTGSDTSPDVTSLDATPAFDPSTLTIPYCSVDEERVQSDYDRMTVEQRIGQHLMLHIQRKGSRVDDAGEHLIRSYALGGVFVSQLTGIAQDDPEASARFLAHAQKISHEASGIPLFISSDQEGGVYTSVNAMTGGTDSIGPAAVGATRDSWVAHDQYDMMAREVRAMGINMNFGPLLDTQYQRDNGNLNTRTFGPDVDVNRQLGVAACLGMQRNLVLPMVKHFPGDGMTPGNTHHEFVVNDASLEVLEDRLLKPFRAAFNAGCEGVMTMPAQFAALDDQRAAITSRLVTTDFLRHELGFDGLVVSDDLNMYGARLGLTEEQSVGVEALKAGADFLLFVGISLEDLDTLIARIQAELQSGTISETDFAASTKRILRFKQRYCLDEAKTELGPVDVADLLTRVGRPEDAAMSMEHATRAVVLLQDNGILPLSGQRVLCVGPSSLLPDPASGWSWLLERSFCESLHEVDPQSDVLDFVIGGGEGVVQYRLEQAWDAYDVVVVATFQAWFSPPQQDLLDWIIETSTIPVVHVSQGVPFDAIWTKGRVAASLALMGSLPVMFQAGSKVLYGLAEAGGTMLFGL